MNDQDIFCDAEKATYDRWPLDERKEVKVTPEAARKAYDKYQFRRQRTISKDFVDKYAAAMEAKTFKEGAVITIAIDTSGTGQRWLVDGNHTLLAIIKYGKPFSLSIEYRLVEDEKDAGALYATFESRRRTLGAIMDAAGLDDETGVSGTMLGRFTTGLLLLELNFPSIMPRLADSAHRQQIITRWAKWCKPVADIIMGGPNSKAIIGRAPVIAMLFATVKYQPDIAKQFWVPITNNDGLKPGTAQHTTASYITTTGGRDCTPAEYFAALAIGWNCFFENRPISHLRVFCGPIRITLAGTPYKNHLTLTSKTERRT